MNRCNMNQNPAKKIGKIQEQIEMEHKARRNYPRKWLKLYEETSWNEMYNQNEINKQLKKDFKDLCPFEHTNEGDSYFHSPEMYKSLVSYCRCGRPRTALHLIKCLQKEKNKYLPKGEEGKSRIEQKCFKKIPETSNGFVGSQGISPQYKQWENSMKYISPIHDMPGEKITATPYNTIIIG